MTKVESVDKHVPAWSPLVRGKGQCMAFKEGSDWCSRADDTITSGWLAGNVIGFLWNPNAQERSYIQLAIYRSVLLSITKTIP